MDSTRWKLVSDLVAQALDQEEGDRTAFVAEHTRGDPGLQGEVESLLAAESGSDGFLDPVSKIELGRLAEEATASDRVGQRVGPYLLERLLGEGGMGQVYLARRADGSFDQLVAVKLVKRGMDTEVLLERFLRERQVLASLDHPGIARLVDGGAAADGRPYLVMEYVRGEPIDRWCATKSLTTVELVRLMLEVCTAVDHAHQRLVVHRDLKPDNVLVSEDGHPKLLDFGLARLLSPDGQIRTRDVTAESDRLLTTQYASPEQIRGDRVTTATDVHALGLLLYELLAGQRPYELKGKSWSEVRRIVCETDPPALSVTAAQGDATRLRGLSGDLDTIVATALRKEPERRYASVGALAEDLGRFLEGLPITARPPTLGYRSGKFVRRNRLLVASVSIIVLVLVGAVIGVSRQARIAEQEAATARSALQEARESLDNAQVVSDFMGNVLLAAAPRRLGRDATVREAVDAAAEQAGSQLAERPWVEGSVRTILGTTYRTLGSARAAVEQLELAVKLRTRELGAEDPLTSSARYELALAYRDLGQIDQARVLSAELLAVWDVPRVRELAGLLALELGEFDRARQFFEQALEQLRETGPNDDPCELVVRKHLATVAEKQGDLAAAEAMLREVLSAQERSLGPQHPDTLITRCDLGTALLDQGRLGEAEEHIRAAYQGFDDQLATEHLDRLIAGERLSAVLSAQGLASGVIRVGAPLLKIADATLGPDHMVTDNLRIQLAWACHDLGRFEEAATLERHSLASARRVFGDDELRTLRSRRNLGRFLLRGGHVEEASVELDQARDGYEQLLGPEDPTTVLTSCQLAQSLLALDRLEEAEGLFARYATALPQESRGGFLKDRGHCLRRLQRFDEAEAVLLEAHELLDEIEGSRSAVTAAVREELALLYEAWSRPDDAVPWRASRR